MRRITSSLQKVKIVEAGEYDKTFFGSKFSPFIEIRKDNEDSDKTSLVDNQLVVLDYDYNGVKPRSVLAKVHQIGEKFYIAGTYSNDSFVTNLLAGITAVTENVATLPELESLDENHLIDKFKINDEEGE